MCRPCLDSISSQLFFFYWLNFNFKSTHKSRDSMLSLHSATILLDDHHVQMSALYHHFFCTFRLWSRHQRIHSRLTCRKCKDVCTNRQDLQAHLTSHLVEISTHTGVSLSAKLLTPTKPFPWCDTESRSLMIHWVCCNPAMTSSLPRTHVFRDRFLIF